MKVRGWHVQLYTNLAMITAIKELVAASPVAVVFDHFGGAQAELPQSARPFGPPRSREERQGLCKNLRRLPVLETGARLFRHGTVRTGADRGQCRTHRVGSDWPHPDSTVVPGRKATDLAPLYQIDDGHLFD
jgi:hypothetical protein